PKTHLDGPLVALTTGAIIGRYQLAEKRGQGNYGEVWMAKDRATGMSWAMKLVLLGGAKGRIEEETLELWKTIPDIPNVVKLINHFTKDGYLILVMGLGECSLLQRLQAALDDGLPGVPAEELLDYMRDAAQGLDYLNLSLHIQHKDVKPENLFVFANGV